MKYPHRLREEARDLMKIGKRIKEISEILSVSTSTVSLWLAKDKQIVSKKCQRCKAEFINIHKGSRYVCYNCRPAKDLPIIDLINETKQCTKCKIWHSFKNYCALPGRYQSYCNTCQASYKSKAKPQIKSQYVTYKGGVCERCKQTYPDICYDFHHRDPSQKEFTISSHRACVFTDTVRKELDKCMMVCSNCHRLIHDELRKQNKP